MSIKGKAYIAGIYEHPTRLAKDISLAQIHAQCAKGALEDAGLTKDDVDGYFCAGDAPGLGPMSMVEYMGLKPRHVDSTDTGGSSYVLHVGHAAEAIAAGKCKVALITLAGRPRAEGMATGTVPRSRGGTPTPDEPFEFPYGPTVVNMYAMCAMRHMHEYGTTSEQLAWIKVAASHHAQHNPHALMRDVVTVEQVVNSPMISDPLHRLDCCVITDGGGAIVVVAPEIAAKLKRPKVKLIGAGEFVKTQMGGKVDLTYSGARFSGAAAFAEAGVKPADIKYASIYDSFTITVLMQLEDLGFCEKGKGGAFVADAPTVAVVLPAAPVAFDEDAEPSAAAAIAGLQSGDVIEEVAGRRMTARQMTVAALLDTPAWGAPLERGGKLSFVTGGPLGDAIMLAMLTAEGGLE